MENNKMTDKELQKESLDTAEKWIQAWLDRNPPTATSAELNFIVDEGGILLKEDIIKEFPPPKKPWYLRLWLRIKNDFRRAKLRKARRKARRLEKRNNPCVRSESPLPDNKPHITREDAIRIYLSAGYRHTMDEERNILQQDPSAHIGVWNEEYEVMSVILSMSDEEYEAMFHDPRFHCDDPDWYYHRDIKVKGD